MRPRLALAAGPLLAAVLSLQGCAGPAARRRTAAADASPPAIVEVGVAPKAIDVSRQEQAAFHFTLVHPAAARVDVVDDAGGVVRRLGLGWRTAGRQVAQWDGRAADHAPVPDGVYRYVIIAEDRSGHRAVYDPSMETGGEELSAWAFQHDPNTGRLQWVMPKAGYVRLRIGVGRFPLLRTLLDWEPMEAGAHAVEWDGKDASGLIDLRRHPGLAITLSAFAMPDNTVIVRHSAQRATAEPGGDAAYPPAFRQPAAYLHARHRRAACREAGVGVAFPGARRDPNGLPLLNGIVPVRVTVEASDARRMTDERFEVSLFEDLTFLFEEEDGATPFTYLWDTSHLTPGRHLLTVNVLGYADHMGVRTVPVMVEFAG